MLSCRDFAGFKLALRLLMSTTRDGHACIVDSFDNRKRSGFGVYPLDENWVVDKVLEENLNIPLGSSITHMNGVDFSQLMRDNRPYYSLSNPETTDLRLFASYLRDYSDSLAVFRFKTPEGTMIERKTPLEHLGGPHWIIPVEKFVQYPDSILYVNTNIITEQELLEKLPELLKAKGIILDLRYYPRIQLGLLMHLLTRRDSLSNCIIKRYIRPGEELPRQGEGEPTWGLEPVEPHIGAAVVALSSRNSQS